MYSTPFVSRRIGESRPGIPKIATAPTAHRTSEPITRGHRQRYEKRGSRSARPCSQWPAVRRSRCVGVLRIRCSAGKSVKTTIQVKKSPTATQSPICRIGRICETARAAKPTAVANSDAVQAVNLFFRAKIWWSSTGSPSGWST